MVSHQDRSCIRLARLKRRADFLRVAHTRKKWATKGLILQIAPTRLPADSSSTDHHGGRVGFTASKRVGGAVQRNRAKRRLRAVADEILGAEAQHDFDYVLIGRTETLERSYDALCGDLRYALRKLKVSVSRPAQNTAQDHGPLASDGAQVPKAETPS